MTSFIRLTPVLAAVLSAMMVQASAQTPPAAPAPAAPAQEPPGLTVPTVPAPSPVQGGQSQGSQRLEIKDSHLKAARELLVASKTLDAFDGLLPNILQQVGLTLTSQNLTVQADPKKRAALSASLKAVEESFSSEREKLYAQIALVYAARFSEPELLKIVEFMKSPEGQKFATLGPLIAQDSFRIANGWAERVGQEAFERVRAEMRKRGEALQ